MGMGNRFLSIEFVAQEILESLRPLFEAIRREAAGDLMRGCGAKECLGRKHTDGILIFPASSSGTGVIKSDVAMEM